MKDSLIGARERKIKIIKYERYFVCLFIFEVEIEIFNTISQTIRLTLENLN